MTYQREKGRNQHVNSVPTGKRTKCNHPSKANPNRLRQQRFTATKSFGA